MTSYFKKDDGTVEWIKILVPLFAMWMAWMTYNGFVTRRLLNLENKMDNKFTELSTKLWQKTGQDNLRHEERIDKLYLLIAGGQDGTEDNINSGQGARSRTSSNEGARVGYQQRVDRKEPLFSY